MRFDTIRINGSSMSRRCSCSKEHLWIRHDDIISNGEMKDNMKIVKFLEKLGLLIKGVSEAIENEARKMLLLKCY